MIHAMRILWILFICFISLSSASTGKTLYVGDQEAYNLYLKGRYQYQILFSEGFDKAIGFFEQAVEKDPGFSLPYFGLGMVYMMRVYWGNVEPHDAYPKSKEYMKKALEIDPGLGEALGLAGYINAFYDWDMEAAEKDFEKGLQLTPSSADIHWTYAEFLTINGQHEKAKSIVNRAQELDPLSAFVNTQVGIVLFFAERYDEAIEHLGTAITLAPHFFLPYLFLTMLYLQQEKLEKAWEKGEEAFKLSEGLPLVQIYLIMACFRTDQKARGELLLKELRERTKQAYVPPACFLIFYLAIGNLDEALMWLERALETRDSYLLWIMIGPNNYIQQTGDPRFAEMLNKYGLL